MHPSKALLYSSIGVACLAEPIFVLHSESPTLSAPPSGMTATKDLERWYRSQRQSMSDAWRDYIDAASTKHAHAQAELLDFAATATQWQSDASAWATQTDAYPYLITETPIWFADLPKDVQSIKLEEGDVWAAILKGKGYSTGAAPRETGRAALGVLAGVAVAAAAL